jgi:TRAP-type C4-dicarboxylate transport system permease small subunit
VPDNNQEPTPVTGSFFSLFMNLVQGIDRLSFWAIVLCMALMAALVSAQVFFRYILSSSIDSADELSRLFFVWAMFLAIPHGIKSGVHVGIDVIVRRLEETIRMQLSRLMSLAGAILMGLLFVMTISVVGDKWQELMPTMEITAAVYYIAVLIATGHAFLHLLVLAWGGPAIWEEVEQ